MSPVARRWIGALIIILVLVPLAGVGVYALRHVPWPTTRPDAPVPLAKPVLPPLRPAAGTITSVPASLPAPVSPLFQGAHDSSVFPGPVSAQVLRVMDGDTLQVRVAIWLEQGMHTRVRLAGIDTPERRGKCAQEKKLAEQARQRTEILVADGMVSLYDIQHDKYGGRVRARVLNAAGIDIAQALVQEGLARPYYGEARNSWCRDSD